MTISKELREAFESLLADHSDEYCVAHNEGQFCCLDEEHENYKLVLSFIAEREEKVKREVAENIKECLKLVPGMSLDGYYRGSTLLPQTLVEKKP